HDYPVILGRDAAGIVQEVGTGVDHVQVGDEVFGHVLLAPPIQAGTLAEYALLPGAAVALKPAELDFVIAAALPLAGTAASAAVDAIDPQPGQTVLVNGASGGVGSYVVQLLAALGVTVVATGTSEDSERLRSLGADTVVDHTASLVADQVRATYPDGVDALVNLAGYTAADVPLDAVRTGGRVSTTTGVPDDETLTARGLTGTSIIAQPVQEVIARLAEQVAAGSLTVHVGAVLPLEQAAEGLATIAGGNAHGKIVVTISN
ncbi:MAG: NADP-dependent oxidoreductase, partial [Actinomycetota bacterium]|nr:NADP-dependent oxidoreductase [Actinomycetota bacterium]